MRAFIWPMPAWSLRTQASKKTTTTTTTRRPRTLDEIRVHSVTTLLNNVAWSPSVQGVTLPDYAVEVLDPSLPGGSLKLVTTNATFHGFKDMAVTWSELIDYPGVLTLKVRIRASCPRPFASGVRRPR